MSGGEPLPLHRIKAELKGHGPWPPENFPAEVVIILELAAGTVTLAGDLRLSPTRLTFTLAETPLPELLTVIPPALLPAQLTVEQGRISGDLTVELAAGSKISGQFRLNGLAGSYRTAFFNGLDLSLPFNLADGRLEVQPIAIRGEEFNPGLKIGPFKAKAAYQASAAAPGKGRLTIIDPEARLLGGLVTTTPLRLDLAQPGNRLHFDLHLEDLDLAKLLAAYPIQGLNGSGTIDGVLPLAVSAMGISIRDGGLAARAPGGVLNYRSEASRALALRNPGLKVMLDALADFRYNVLAGVADYQEDGTLRLALRLEGFNPALEQGRPIHFNLKIEENIPALLAGIQLSNRISDLIRRRIQERYQQPGP